MCDLFQYRESDYFEKFKNEFFIFHTLKPLQHLSKVEYDKGWWFKWHNPMMIKATSTPCFRLKELAPYKIAIKDMSIITGTVGGGGWGLDDSSLIYIYWDRIPNLKLGFPCALFNLNDLFIVK